jgi:H+-transporting ATPase
MGLIALSDPPRSDSSSLISELQALGVATVMVTGNAPATAAIVAHDVGLDGAVFPPGELPEGVKPEDLQYSQAFFQKASMTLSRHSRRVGIRLGCAAMTPMMHLRSARHRSV